MNIITYSTVVENLSNLTGLGFDLTENLIGTVAVLAGYFTLSLIFSRAAVKRLSEEYREEVVSEIIPSSLRLVAFGILAKIWLTGGASFESNFSVSKSLMANIVQTIYVILFYFGAKFAAEIFVDIKFSNQVEKQYASRRTVAVLLSVICLFFILKIWLYKTDNFSTYLGLLSAGIAIALQDVILSLAGWVYILTVKPFKIGDRVQIEGQTGDIIDIKLLQFCILETGNWVGAEQTTGRILYFPNSFALKNTIANYDSGFEYIFSEIPITVTFESNWQLAREVLSPLLEKEVSGVKDIAAKQIRKASKDMRIRFAHLEPRVIVSVVDFGVLLTLRFLCKVRERRFVESRLWEKVLLAFSKESTIDFAYPTTRYYLNSKEGKPGAGGPRNSS